MACRMLTSTPTVRYAMGTLIAVLLLVLGGALLAGLVSIDRPLPPVGTAVSATATISDNRIKPGEMTTGRFPGRTPDRHFVTVTYAVSDTRVETHEIEVGQAYFNTKLPGRQVTVWYFPERPQVSVLDDPAELRETGSRFGTLLGLVLVATGACAGLTFGNRLVIARRGYGVL